MGKRSVDDAIREALRANDPAAVELLWRRYADDLLAYLAATLRSRDDAEDVLQAVFVRMVRKRHKLAKARRLDPYVYRIARNEAISHVRHRSRARDDGAIASPWLAASNAEHGRTELVDLIENALGRLPDSQRQVVVLKVYRGKTLREIGNLLGISLNTAASRYRYAMEKLRALLKEQLS